MAGAKGFALTVALEVLTSVISGGLTGKEVPRDALASTDVFYPVKVSHYFHAIDVGKVMPLERVQGEGRLTGPARYTTAPWPRAQRRCICLARSSF